MIRLVFAHYGDQTARDIVRAFGPDAHLITARELSRCGWRHHPTSGGTDALPVGDDLVPASAIAGVITRISAVTPGDLPHIVASDREYVAAEMSAFLLSFLTGLSCPVINAPTAGSLMGPGWTLVRWRAAAVAAGFAASDLRHAEGDRIVVVGERCFGARSTATAAAAVRLAQRARVELLGMTVVEAAAAPRMTAIEPWCALAGAALEALEDRFTARAA